MSNKISLIVDNANHFLNFLKADSQVLQSETVIEQFNHLKELRAELNEEKSKKTISKSDMSKANETIEKINKKMGELRSKKNLAMGEILEKEKQGKIVPQLKDELTLRRGILSELKATIKSLKDSNVSIIDRITSVNAEIQLYYEKLEKATSKSNVQMNKSALPKPMDLEFQKLFNESLVLKKKLEAESKSLIHDIETFENRIEKEQLLVDKLNNRIEQSALSYKEMILLHKHKLKEFKRRLLDISAGRDSRQEIENLKKSISAQEVIIKELESLRAKEKEKEKPFRKIEKPVQAPSKKNDHKPDKALSGTPKKQEVLNKFSLEAQKSRDQLNSTKQKLEMLDEALKFENEKWEEACKITDEFARTREELEESLENYRNQYKGKNLNALIHKTEERIQEHKTKNDAMVSIKVEAYRKYEAFLEKYNKDKKELEGEIVLNKMHLINALEEMKKLGDNSVQEELDQIK